MEFVVARCRPLADLLSRATSSDLEVLADLITDNGKGRVALDSKVKALILTHRQQGTLQEIASVLEAEIRAFAGNSVLNLFRSNAVSYDVLAADVARKLGGKPQDGDDIFAVEEIIIREAIAKSAPEQAGFLQQGGAALSALLGHIVQNWAAASGTIVGTVAAGGAAGVAGVIGGRVATLALPPLAIVAAGATLFQAAGPAFRITVPAVLQVAKIRRSQVDAEFNHYVEGLRACL